MIKALLAALLVSAINPLCCLLGIVVGRVSLWLSDLRR